MTLAGTGQIPGIAELVVLSTCNRAELYAVATADAASQTLLDLLLPPGMPAGITYALTDHQCVQHILRVAAGLDSQVIGEPQIMGQITQAYERAKAARSAGPVLSALMQHAIHTGKRVRHETALAKGALSISAVAARHAHRIAGSLERANVLIIGAGDMAQSAAGSLIRRGVGRLVVANRTLEHAQALADDLNAAVIPYDQIGEALVEADIVITASAAPRTLLHVADLIDVLSRRQGRSLLIFDIAMPRNVDPEVRSLPGVQLYNLDDLQGEAELHRAEREGAVPEAGVIVADEVEEFDQWQAGRAVAPVIQQLRAKAETVRQAELEQLSRRLPDLSERDRQVLDQLLDSFSHRLVNKLLHNPTLRLKAQSSEGQGELYASIVSDLFDLGANGR